MAYFRAEMPGGRRGTVSSPGLVELLIALGLSVMEMSLSVAGKYAVITGAGSGINLAFAKLLLERGCSVLIGDLALRPEASSLVSQYSPQPSSSDSSRPSAHFQQTNVASWPQLSRLWDTALATFPRVDIVVPGAGIFEPAWSSFWHAPKTASNPDTQSRDAAEAEPGTYAVIDVNLTHPIRLSQLAIGHWTQTHRPGCLVHVSSVAGHAFGFGTPLYFASKHGLHAFVRSMGEMRDRVGIRCSAVAPGAVMTPMWREDPDKKHMAGDEDAKLFTEPEEIARGMLELCENPEYGNGTILEVVKGRKRVVPFYHAEPPQGDGVFIPKYKEGAEKLWDGLESEGLKV